MIIPSNTMLFNVQAYHVQPDAADDQVGPREKHEANAEDELEDRPGVGEEWPDWSIRQHDHADANAVEEC